MLAGLPQTVAARQIRHQGVGAQLAGSRRFRQVEHAQVLAEKPGETLHIGCRSREPHHAARRRDMAVLEAAFELHHRALACREEGAELGEQRGERGEQQGVIFQLAIELTAAAEALGGVEGNARLRRASGEHIEHGELLTAYAACKTGARQAQCRTDGAHTHARQARQRIRRPAQAGERQRRQLSDELCRIRHREGLACAGRDQRRECRGRERQHRLHLQTPALAPERAAQSRHPREQVQAPLHFEQQAIRRRQAHARREPLRADRKLLQLFRVDSRQM